MKKRVGLVVALLALFLFAGPVAAEGGLIKNDDGKADGKKSLGGSGEMILFTLPAEGGALSGVRVHGSRYGVPQAPDEDFLVYVMSEDLSKIVHVEMAPYSLFERGDNRWVEIEFDEPVTVPETFWVVLDFRAGRTKGVYVSFDTSTKGENSKIGLPGLKARPVDFEGDWMIRAELE